MNDQNSATENMSLSQRLERKIVEAASKEAVSRSGGGFERPRYARHLDFIRVAPPTLQIVMLSVIETADARSKSVIKVGDAYDACLNACTRWSVKPISPEAYRCYLAELDLYDLLRYPREQRSESFTTRRIWLKQPKNVLAKMRGVILSALQLRFERQSSGMPRDSEKRQDSTR